MKVYSINNAIVYVRILHVSISEQQDKRGDKNKARFKFYYLLSCKFFFFFQ
jgi:hypothetical protein